MKPQGSFSDDGFRRRNRRRYGRQRLARLRRKLGLEILEGRRLLATLIVSSTEDLVDLNPGDGVCEVSPGGACTLRAAIQEGNALGSTGEPIRIEVPEGTFALGITGLGNNAGDLDITGSMVLQGTGAGTTIIDGNAIDRVFDVRGGVVEIRGVTIEGGSVSDPDALVEGSGGGIRNEADLTLADSLVTGNLATLGAGIGNYNGSLRVERSVISGNGDALTMGGGGISNFSYYDPADVAVTDSTVSGNRGNEGGGIRNYAYDGIANFTITRSTVSGNNAGSGGGLFNRGEYYSETNTSANLTITNSTVSGNEAASTGGGLHSEASQVSNSIVTVSNSTFAENRVISGAGGGLFVVESPGTVTTLTSVIVASNTSSQPGNDLSSSNAIVSYSLISTLDGHSLSDGVDNNLIGVEAQLGPLSDNGGPTMTHLVSPGSPAIDQGINALRLVGDQRGSAFDRTVNDAGVTNADDGTDIGAVEVGQIGAINDFGDAPDGVFVGSALRFYPTSLANDGARHVVTIGGPRLGTIHPDSEFDGISSVTAMGDDLVGFDDEDGIRLDPLVLNPGQNATGLTLTHDGGSGGAFLSVWIDLNLDGDWDDPGEQVLVDSVVPSGPGTTSLEGFMVPAEAPMGITFLRSRISTQSGLSPRGEALDGEVEDFVASIGEPPPKSADLSLANVVSDSNPARDEQVTFTLTVSNAGPDRATGVEVTALLPEDLSFVRALANQGNYEDFSGIWTVGALNPNSTAQIILTATVETTDSVNFTAEITSANERDPNSTPGNGISGEDDQATAAIGTCLVGSPLVVGMNRLTYPCASPGAFTAFVRGTQRGSFTFEQYRTTVDIADAEEIAIGVADATGVAEALFYVDEASLGDSFLYQAFEMFPRSHKTNTLRLAPATSFLHALSQGSGANALQRDVIEANIVHARSQWESANLSGEQWANLQGATITISELPGTAIARAIGRTIVLDADAAGHGWFVDSSPWESSEFSVGPMTRTALVDSAAGKIDLMTTLVHEFGHLLGLRDVSDSHHVMHESLMVGQRRLLESDTNPLDPHDVNGDQIVSSLDALTVINRLSHRSMDMIQNDSIWIGLTDAVFFDTNGDFRLSAVDALRVINRLQRSRDSEGEQVPSVLRPESEIKPILQMVRARDVDDDSFKVIDEDGNAEESSHRSVPGVPFWGKELVTKSNESTYARCETDERREDLNLDVVIDLIAIDRWQQGDTEIANEGSDF